MTGDYRPRTTGLMMAGALWLGLAGPTAAQAQAVTMRVVTYDYAGVSQATLDGAQRAPWRRSSDASMST